MCVCVCAGCIPFKITSISFNIFTSVNPGTWIQWQVTENWLFRKNYIKMNV